MSNVSQLSPANECCRWARLRFPVGHVRCYRHATVGERKLLSSLDERGRKIGLEVRGVEVLWPYGANISVGTRQRLVEWAERNGYRSAPNWNGWNRIFREDFLRDGWMDHLSFWVTKDDCRLLVAQPYSIWGDGLAQLAELDEHPSLDVQVGGHGWYGHGTVYIAIKQSESRRKAPQGPPRMPARAPVSASIK